MAITNGPAAGYGVFLGTIATDASGATVSWSLGSSAAGGGAAVLNVWNNYNRVIVAANVQDSSSWSYSSGTIRAADGSNTNRVTLVIGLQEDGIHSRYDPYVSYGADYHLTSIGVDSTTTAAAGALKASGYQSTKTDPSTWAGVLLGSHFVQALEASNGSQTTFGPAILQLVTRM